MIYLHTHAATTIETCKYIFEIYIRPWNLKLSFDTIITFHWLTFSCCNIIKVTTDTYILTHTYKIMLCYISLSINLVCLYKLSCNNSDRIIHWIRAFLSEGIRVFFFWFCTIYSYVRSKIIVRKNIHPLPYNCFLFIILHNETRQGNKRMARKETKDR